MLVLPTDWADLLIGLAYIYSLLEKSIHVGGRSLIIEPKVVQNL